MNALIDYGSSDEDDVDDIQPERPANIARTVATDVASELQDEHIATIEQRNRNPAPSKKYTLPEHPPSPSTEPNPRAVTTLSPSDPSEHAVIGPSIPPSRNNESNEQETSTTPLEPQLSPYSTERQRIHDLTLPRTGNFEIPDSPPPPSSTEETTRAAALARTTAKFTRFRELKTPSSSSASGSHRKDRGAGSYGDGGVHFHDRLLRSAALRNPSLFSTLLRFAGVSEKESYATILEVREGGSGVTVEWPEECYVEGLMRLNERRRKEKAKGREKVDFVRAGDATGG